MLPGSASPCRSSGRNVNRLTNLCAAPRQLSELIAVETARAVLCTKCQHRRLFDIPVRMLVSRSALSKRPFCTRDVGPVLGRQWDVELFY